MSIPQFALIKDHIVQQIENRLLCPGDRVPSENQLLEQFSVSRMTARRALQELADAGVLVRSQGLGTFVADARPVSSMLEIRNIADEIKTRSHHYSCDIVRLQEVSASHLQAPLLSVQEGAVVFHSVLLHIENGVPIQYEERYVNPVLAPHYLQQDFQQQTPNAYLSAVAPLTEVDHVVEAVCVDTSCAKLLRIDAEEPCLKITRRTWSSLGVVSLAYLVHPGSRYRLGGHLNFV